MKDYKVSEMPYNRPSKEELIGKLKEFELRLNNAKDGKETLEILKEYSALNTLMTKVIRF